MVSDEIVQLVTKLRHALNKMAELSGCEINTEAAIESFARKHGADEIIIGLGGHSVAVVMNGNGIGKTLMLRCDMDAIQTECGAAHLCGHDGHIAIIAGLIPLLHKNKPERGRVILLFQAAEENGCGALALLSDPSFTKLSPDLIIALHNLPGFEKQVVVVKNGVFAMASNGLKIVLKGLKSHAAEPENGINPAQAIADIISFVNELNDTGVRKSEKVFATIVHISVGERAFGSAAGDAEIWLTLRAARDTDLVEINHKIKEKAQLLSELYCLVHEFEISDVFPATVNNNDCVELIREAALEVNFPLIEAEASFRWSEDFGHYSKLAKSAMFGLGAGVGHFPLHSEKYEFPDDIIKAGVSVFAAIIAQVNGLKTV